MIATGLLAGCATSGKKMPEATTLKDAFKNDFLIGAALNPSQFTGANAKENALVKEQFNSISPENVLKWALIHPEPNKYDFGPADRYVEFGEQNHMVIIGHTLVWHSQTPRWVFRDANGNPVDRDTLLARMRDHIFTVVGRYKGKIHGWDVVNEALNEDGTLRRSPWERIIGDDYILKAFQFAHEADPNAELYYNDYSLENKPKREGAIKLIKKLQLEGVHIAAVGLQGHYKMDWPTTRQLDDTIKAFSKLGVKVNITELDIDVLPRATRSRGADVSMRAASRANLNPYTNGLPASVQRALAKRYASLFRVFVKERKHIDRVTFWGVTDKDSWLNNWPVRGRTAYPLLFDRECQPKPAFYAVIKTAK
ncbi:MAG TPA: endo-1,4-beta-xylanase [Verrucomicrobiae bacterium]|nr:endo-1,4-beta-xylanase [Verrucomicrobiae bacterium]